MFNFGAASVNVPLKAPELKEQDSLSLPLSTVQRLEQDTCVLTTVGSFLDCSGATSTHLLEEAILDENASEGIC